MNAELQIHLLPELEAEVARWRRRTMFLVSVILHALLVTFLLVSPEIFRRGAQMMGLAVQPRSRQTTFLWIPPEVLKRLREPPETSILSDRNRRAQGRSPNVDPNGLRMPYSRGNTPLPEIAGGAPPAAAPPPPPGGPAAPPSPPPPDKQEKEEARLRLMDVPATPVGGGDSGLHLPLSTPGDAIQQSLQAAVRGRGGGSSPGPGDSTEQMNNLRPNFSTEGPIILSDTRGVDFGPYLARIVFIVRRNWYAVIPEAAILGQKGRVAVDFAILKDGSVPELQTVASSGYDSLDHAALAGIRASIPFPPLPDEFTGNHLRLRFIFLYNMGYGP